MGCCVGADHSNWCEDYDIVYIDAEGKEYCIFHAPAECKFVELYDEREGGKKPALMRAEQFNGLVFARIDGVIEEGEDEERDEWDPFDWNPRCNFSGTIIPYDISFSQYSGQNDKSLPPINYSDSQFQGLADFSGSQFQMDSSFRSAHFYGTAVFYETQFNGDADFDEVLITGGADFNEAVFNKNTNFYASRFNNDVEFNEAKFTFDADFNEAKFKEEAYFNEAQFKGNAYFNKTQFIKDTSFYGTQFKGNADFFGSKFSEEAYFRSSKFHENIFFSFCYCKNINLIKAESLKQADFSNSNFLYSFFDEMLFHGSASFNNVTFEKHSSFRKTIFHDYCNFEQSKFKEGAYFRLTFFKEWSYFRKATFVEETTFTGAISKETILFESVNLSNLKFTETNIESFKFIDCNWGEERFAPILDEREQQALGCTNTTLAEIYRRLKRIARESADEEQTSHWHYREKEMTRKSLDCVSSTPFWNVLITAIFMIPACAFFLKMQHEYLLNFAVGLSLILTATGIGYNDFKKIKKDINKVASKLYLNTYKFISGYGEEPIRAGTILFVLVFIPILLQFIISLTPWANKDWLKHAMWYMPLIKISLPDSQGYQYLLKGISVTFITLQAALFGFALRNKLRR